MSRFNGSLIILCGIPSSGKSGFAKSLASSLSSQLKTMNIKIIDIDKVRVHLFENEFSPENEPFVRETALIETRKYLESNSIVIVDDINYFNSMRHEFKQIAFELKKPYMILYISTPLEVCLEWNNKRRNTIDEKIITTIADKFDIPGKKYLWDAPFDVIDISTDNIAEKINIITDHVVEITQKKPITFDSKPDKNTQSIKYEIDLLTRLFVTEYANLVFTTSSNAINTENKDNKLTLFQNVAKKVTHNPLFKQIQAKFSNNIGKLNTERRNFIETFQFRDYIILDRNSEMILIQILVDFMQFLLK